jgi:hypothetical protein
MSWIVCLENAAGDALRAKVDHIYDEHRVLCVLSSKPPLHF